jgi:hypothetical protein
MSADEAPAETAESQMSQEELDQEMQKIYDEVGKLRIEHDEVLRNLSRTRKIKAQHDLQVVNVTHLDAFL